MILCLIICVSAGPRIITESLGWQAHYENNRKKGKKQVMPKITNLQFHKKYKACIMPTTIAWGKNKRQLLSAFLPSTFALS